MTRRQLEEDVYNAESEYDVDAIDPDAQFEGEARYRLYGGGREGGKARMPDMSRVVILDDGSWSHVGKDGYSIFE